MMIKEYNTKCAAIAKHLGGTFHSRAVTSWIFIGEVVLPGGVAFTVRHEERLGKLEVSAVWPTNQKKEMFHPYRFDKSGYREISVSIGRDADDLAKDIQRRFLPGFVAELNTQKARCANSDAHINLTEKNTAHLARVAHGKRYDSHPTEFSFDSERSSVYGKAKVSGDNVNIEVNNLSPAQAEAILKLVATL